MKFDKPIYLAVTNDLVYDQRLLKMAAVIANLGYRVVLIGRNIGSSTESMPLPFESKRFKCIFNSGVAFYLEYNLRLLLYLISRPSMAIVANDADTLAACALVSIFRRCKLIYDSHEYFTEVPELSNEKIKKWVWHSVQKWGIRQSVLCITVADQLAVELTRVYKKPFEVIRNLPLKSESPSQPQPSNIMIYQGALNIDRGIELAIESLLQLEDWQLWVVGDGPERDALIHLTNSLELTERVTFWGRKTPSELKKITPKASVGLNMLRGESLNYYFSLANKFFDYVHAGLPGVSMNFPEYQHLNRQHQVAVLLESYTVDELAAAIRKMSTQPDFYHRMVEACTKASEVWNWDEESKKVRALYQSVLDPVAK